MSHINELIKSHGIPPKEVYFDGENSGFVPIEVVKAMIPYYQEMGYGHPSITHLPGWQAYEVIMSTRESVIRSLNGDSDDEVTFTHSGTEANNLAIIGGALANKDKGKKILISTIEHQSVLFPAKSLEDLGFRVMEVPVDGDGFVDQDLLDIMTDKETVLVSIQLVNQEIGTIQRIREIIEVVKDKNPNVIFHTDAADAYGKMHIDVDKLDVDMITISGHKIHAPRGVGVLYHRDGVSVRPIIHGALSTQKVWPGVENVPLIAGFREAVKLAFSNMEENNDYVRSLRDKLFKGIVDGVDELMVNGPMGDERVADNLNISFLYVEGEAITVELSLRGIYVSSGSACTSRVLEPSHVMLAIGRKHEEAHGSVLFKITRYHTDDDVLYAVEQIPSAIQRLRELSPLSPDKYKNYDSLVKFGSNRGD